MTNSRFLLEILNNDAHPRAFYMIFLTKYNIDKCFAFLLHQFQHRTTQVFSKIYFSIVQNIASFFRYPKVTSARIIPSITLNHGNLNHRNCAVANNPSQLQRVQVFRHEELAVSFSRWTIAMGECARGCVQKYTKKFLVHDTA